MCAVTILEENTLPALPDVIPLPRQPGSHSLCLRRCPELLSGSIRQLRFLAAQMRSVVPDWGRGLVRNPLDLVLRERREMHTKRLIASSRRPTPPVGDLVCELPLGLLVLACSIGASRSASTPGTLHDRIRRLIVALQLPVLRARPLSAMLGGVGSPQRIRLEDATSRRRQPQHITDPPPHCVFCVSLAIPGC